MTTQKPHSSSSPKPSGIPKPTKGSRDQGQSPEISRRSSIPVRRKSTAPEPPESPLRSSSPDTGDCLLNKDRFSISSLATSVAGRGCQYGSKDRHKTGGSFRDRALRLSGRLENLRNQQQASNITASDVTTRDEKLKAHEPWTPEQHRLKTPVSLNSLCESESKHRAEVPLRQTKPTQPVLQIPCAIIVDPKDHVPGTKIETDSAIDVTSESTPTDSRSPADVSPPQKSLAHNARTPFAEITSLIYALEHFTFFCLLDPSSPDEPFTCASNFPWSSTQLQEKLKTFCVDALREGGKVCDIIADASSDGPEKSYLALVDNFHTVTPESHDYSLACVVDVTSFINAATPECHMHESQTVNEAGIRHDYHKTKERPMVPIVSSDRDKLAAAVRNDGEARRRISVARRERRSLRLKHYLARNTREDPTSNDLVDRTTAEFTNRFLEFYSNCFMLSRSPSDDEYYEMTHVSDNIYRRKEHIDGHLTHSSREVFRQVRKALGRDERFTIRVRWGHEPIEKRLYCVPLIDPETQGWICLLVDSDVPLLWHTGYRGYFG